MKAVGFHACTLCFLLTCSMVDARAQPPGREARLGCSSAAETLADPRNPLYPVSMEEFDLTLKKALNDCALALREKPDDESIAGSAAIAFAFAGDFSAAATQAKIAADQGAGGATGLLGALHAQGRGIRRDLTRAVDLLHKAERKSDALAAYNLGVLYASGEGVDQDDAEAFRYYLAAAQRRDVLAMLRVAQSYLDGRGIVANRQAAESWWRKAAEQSNVEGRPHPARLTERRPLSEALEPSLAWLRAQAEANEAWAQAFLGELYERGQLVAQNYALALNWYRRAAEQHNDAGEWALSRMYAQGRGVAMDREESARWFYRGSMRKCERELGAPPGGDECDRLAGDPYDPRRIGTGAASHCLALLADQAVAACRKSLRAAPATVRFRAQLARALAHAGEYAEARHEAEIAARAGSTTAMMLMGAMHESTAAADRDPAAALQWYRRAAASGENEQALLHALRLETVASGRNSAAVRKLQAQLSHLPQAWPKASPDLYRDALLRKAELGNARSQYAIAVSYERGEGVPRSDQEAAKWYRKAAAQGHSGSRNSLAQMFQQGVGVDRNPDEAMRLYRESAEAGNLDACWELALMLRDKGDYSAARVWLNRMATEDDGRAMTELANWYESGRGVAPDAKDALRWYERAAPASKWAQFKVAAMLTAGRGVPRNDVAAFKHWKKLADAGNADALNNLGVMYVQGRGVEKNLARATEKYLEAAKRGSSHARGNLELIFDEG